MSAVVVISIMFGAVIAMVKKADKEMTTMRVSSRPQHLVACNGIVKGRAREDIGGKVRTSGYPGKADRGRDTRTGL
jgi:hypothetical protein